MEELINLIVSKLGVNEDQAKGGAGLLFKLAKEKLGAGDFGEVSNAVSGVEDLIQAAPEAGGASGLLGGLVSKLGGGGLGDLAKLAGGFKSLNLDTDTAKKFVPVVLEFVQGKGGDNVKAILQKVLGG